MSGNVAVFHFGPNADRGRRGRRGRWATGQTGGRCAVQGHVTLQDGGKENNKTADVEIKEFTEAGNRLEQDYSDASFCCQNDPFTGRR